MAKKARLSATLPATRVTPEMHAAVHQYADEHDVDLADVDRAAIEMFLSAARENEASTE